MFLLFVFSLQLHSEIEEENENGKKKFTFRGNSLNENMNVLLFIPPNSDLTFGKL